MESAVPPALQHRVHLHPSARAAGRAARVGLCTLSVRAVIVFAHEYGEMIMCYSEARANVREEFRIYVERYPDRRHPSDSRGDRRPTTRCAARPRDLKMVAIYCVGESIPQSIVEMTISGPRLSVCPTTYLTDTFMPLIAAEIVWLYDPKIRSPAGGARRPHGGEHNTQPPIHISRNTSGIFVNSSAAADATTPKNRGSSAHRRERSQCRVTTTAFYSEPFPWKNIPPPHKAFFT
ncbi:hypothetical protein EVAR_7751_1 [Eumeta japonica]|uniref:DUF4817 domain-containing protein n=1 Tax=Eumeta variegata TaxID=151549 RepID=A0A4C1TIU4_EUMVA|nr:hypothetical protein EVAR_7751_1 [Eumeta japonica]